ncbi:MAG: hypothetical protein HYZ93_03325 [Candidatus Omnitrophica bacterium]|nr:hypothetical protein [Candidatus Omnitrophota bacterium]
MKTKRFQKFILSSLLFLLATGNWPVATSFAASLLVDDFEGSETKNKLGNRANVFIKAPSKAMVSRRGDAVQGKQTHVLMLRYEKKATGGPYDSGGWCGYYTLLKSPGALVAPTPDNPNPAPIEEQFLDGSPYKAITLWVRGEKGDENFVVGLSDRHWDQVGDSVKSQEIGKYLPAGKLTTEWQKATIPMDEFFLDYGQLASVAVVFEGDLFPQGGHAGVVYVDDIALE